MLSAYLHLTITSDHVTARLLNPSAYFDDLMVLLGSRDWDLPLSFELPVIFT